MELVNILVMNGVPELAAKHAVLNSGYTTADDAIMWFYSNMENPVLTQPLVQKKSDSNGP